MPRFGAHLSIAGGLVRAVERARRLRADCLQVFLKSPTQWRFGPLTDETAKHFRREARQAGLVPVVGHASYLLNLASPDRALRRRSERCLMEEWDRAERLGLDALVLHPGSHTGSGEAAGLARIIRVIDRLHARRPRQRVFLALETTAGAGDVLCGRFQHLRAILDGCADGQRLAVAIDTCHLWAAGYDLATSRAVDETLGKLDRTVGLDRVRVVHANDARGALGSGLDRHAHIGRGKIGREGFRALVNHPALRDLPFILETPKEGPRGKEMDPVNLRTLRRLVAG